jgi:hypothetical protein
MISLKEIINRFGSAHRDAAVNLEEEIRAVETQTRDLDREKGELERELAGMASRRKDLLREDEIKKILALDDRAAEIHVLLEMSDEARVVLAKRLGNVRSAERRVRLAKLLATAADLAEQRLATYRTAIDARNAEARHRDQMSREGFEAEARHLPDAFRMYGEPELRNVASTIESVRRHAARLEATPLTPQAPTPVAGNHARPAAPQAPTPDLSRLSLVDYRPLSKTRGNTRHRPKPGQAAIKLLQCFDGDDGREYVPGDIVALPRNYAIALCHELSLAEWIPTGSMDPLPPLPADTIETETAIKPEDRRRAKLKRASIFQEAKDGEVQILILRSGCEIEGVQYALGDVIALPADHAERVVRAAAAEFYHAAEDA